MTMLSLLIFCKQPLKSDTSPQQSPRGHCPFRGCAGDWVKLGVAKHHGAVLGDAIYSIEENKAESVRR